MELYGRLYKTGLPLVKIEEIRLKSALFFYYDNLGLNIKINNFPLENLTELGT